VSTKPEITEEEKAVLDERLKTKPEARDWGKNLLIAH
jgi:hypothetical protein